MAVAGLPARHGEERLGPHRQLHRQHGVWGLTKALGKEFGPKGITVNAISPGPISADVEDDGESNHHRLETMAKVPLGRMGTPDEMGAVAAFLASEGAGFITGSTIDVNGGTRFN